MTEKWFLTSEILKNDLNTLGIDANILECGPEQYNLRLYITVTFNSQDDMNLYKTVGKIKESYTVNFRLCDL